MGRILHEELKDVGLMLDSGTGRVAKTHRPLPWTRWISHRLGKLAAFWPQLSLKLSKNGSFSSSHPEVMKSSLALLTLLASVSVKAENLRGEPLPVGAARGAAANASNATGLVLKSMAGSCSVEDETKMTTLAGGHGLVGRGVDAKGTTCSFKWANL